MLGTPLSSNVHIAETASILKENDFERFDHQCLQSPLRVLLSKGLVFV